VLSATPATLSHARLRDGLTNVDPMSNQPETQGNASPPASVRAQTPPEQPSHGASQHAADLGAVTPKTLAQTGRSKTAPLTQDNNLWKSSVDRPQLSERDSIFATTYLVADSPTSSPRTSAPPIDTDDDARKHSASDLAMPMPPLRSLIDTPVFRRKQSSHQPAAPHDQHALFPSHLNARKSTVVGMVSDDRRQSPVGSPLLRSTIPNHPSVRSALDERLEDSEKRSRNKAWREGKLVSFKGTGAAEDVTLDNELEKKIDVTLAKTEQPVSGRSRKASHYLGVFKDAGGTEGSKKRDTAGKERRATEKALSTVHQEEPTRAPTGEPSALTEQLRGSSRPPSAAPSPQGGPTESYFDKTPTARNEIGPSPTLARKGNVSVAGAIVHKRPLPDYVLDEIRAISNLTPGAQPGSSFSRSLPTSAAEKYHAQVPKAVIHHQEPTDYFQPKSVDNADHSPASEEEDSEREQISSALYFPHRPQQTTDFDPVETQDHEVEEDSFHRKSSFTAAGIGSGGRVLREGHRMPHGVEISLNSQDTNQCLHGDIHTTTPMQQEEAKSLTSTSIDALSADSETESLAESTHSLLEYDSSATDDLGTTPTATSHRDRSKTVSIAPPQPPAPLEAVELKPFDHQVGGHSTVYRFSRRAVCKQLNNRENEFYETVEKQHPDLLDFLPRYATIYPVSMSEAETSNKILSLSKCLLTCCSCIGISVFLMSPIERRQRRKRPKTEKQERLQIRLRHFKHRPSLVRTLQLPTTTVTRKTNRVWSAIHSKPRGYLKSSSTTIAISSPIICSGCHLDRLPPIHG
jgi:hypothetical protein